MTGLYDIHTHILPGVDDGSRNMQETRRMLQMQRQQGVLHVIAAPHFAVGERQESPENLRSVLNQVREIAKQIDPEMTIDLGNELLNGPGVITALQQGEALTLAGTRYILVEFLPSDRYSLIYQSLRDYIMEGYIPVVAHMERYEALLSDRNRIVELIMLGAYFQMNAESLMGRRFSRRPAVCRRLVEEGMIHFIGSDCHRSDHRIPLMQDALAYLSGDFRQSGSFLKLVQGNPQKLMADQFL